jgi:hypothetical protein
MRETPDAKSDGTTASMLDNESVANPLAVRLFVYGSRQANRYNRFRRIYIGTPATRERVDRSALYLR